MCVCGFVHKCHSGDFLNNFKKLMIRNSIEYLVPFRTAVKQQKAVYFPFYF